MNKHNDLLKACPRRPSTLRTFVYITLGWVAAIALCLMGSIAFISPN